ncbi:MAG: rRNA pseudouridine synthase [Planctomycetes bacterium]|nr:rRNA pseudouridine synthase [Planctomycetota bacterium]
MTAKPTDHDESDFDEDWDVTQQDKSKETVRSKDPSGQSRPATSSKTKRNQDVSTDSSDSESQSETERLQKVLAAAGLASRRHCEEYILEGRVTVDGKTVQTLGIKVNPETQVVCVDGERIKLERKRHFLVYKPPGVLCTNADPMGRVRVIDLLPPTQGRLFTVGRLDETSEGMILVTNDGELAHKLAHPKFQVERLYRALVAGIPNEATLRQLRQGLYFTEGKFRVRDIRSVKTSGKATIVELVLTEGQNREVRRLFARVGHKVMRLKRIGFGPLRLGDLPIGHYRPLTPTEMKLLRQSVEGTSPSRSRTRGKRSDRVAPQRGRSTGQPRGSRSSSGQTKSSSGRTQPSSQQKSKPIRTAGKNRRPGK